MTINFWGFSFSNGEDQHIHETRHSGDAPRTLWDKDAEAAAQAGPVTIIFPTIEQHQEAAK